jgi:hypothetical protein
MFDPIDAYCERLSPGFWAEPVNAVTNAAFLVAALILWRRTRGLPMGRALSVIIGMIGVGSFLFHTFATGLTAALDVAPILLFILVYLFAATRDLLGWGGWWPWAATLAFLPYAVLAGQALGAVLPLGSSAAYAPIPPLILAYAALLWRRAPATARGMALGAAILVLSLTFRTLDYPLCDSFPLGTHFLWHILNAVMLAWMVEVWRRHQLATGPARG